MCPVRNLGGLSAVEVQQIQIYPNTTASLKNQLVE
jgi:hypothetical protein